MFRTPISILLLCLMASSASTLSAAKPGAMGRGPEDVTKINQEEGERLIGEFRQQRLRGDYVFLFDLENIPHRGKRSTYEGIIWGTWNEKGPLSRTVIWEPGKKERKPLLQIIAQGGPEPHVWIWEPGKEVRELPSEEYFNPLLPGNDYSAFDLLMPYIFWENYVYEGSRQVLGRPAHQFLVWPPEEIRAAKPEIGAAFVALDAGYNALVKAELLDDTGDEIKTLAIRSFKKVDDQYIIKQIDITDEISRDNTRFLVRGAAVGQDLQNETFDPKLIEWIPDTTKIPFKGV